MNKIHKRLYRDDKDEGAYPTSALDSFSWSKR